MDSKKYSAPINVDVGARVEAKLDVRATVPEQSTGRLLDAVTDIIRPFSEARGLKADLIRLQREDVAIEIAKRARIRLELEGLEVQPVPNKVLVPLLEAGSNEDIEDTDMLDAWANLLASATKPAGVPPRLVSVLSELEGRQAKALERLAKNNSEAVEFPLRDLADAPNTIDTIFVKQKIYSLFQFWVGPVDVEKIFSELDALINKPGAIVADIIVSNSEDMWSFSAGNLRADWHDFQSDLEILASIGLCRYASEYFRSESNQEVSVFYYYITELGVRLYFACNNINFDRPDLS